jgi:uncharacterized membrane protein
MIEVIFFIIVGIFIGWYLPQPAFIKDSINELIEFIKTKLNWK